MRHTLWSAALFCTAAAAGQQCTTQSQMQPADRTSVAQAALSLAQMVQRNDAAGLKAASIPEFAAAFSNIAAAVAATAPHLQGATMVPQTLWLLDSSASTEPQDTQFFCTLNRTTQETTFAVPALAPGRYALAVLDAIHAPLPYALAVLLRQDKAGIWQMAGLYPRFTTAAGHDGLWYWRDARAAAAKKENWSAWVEYSEAERLLKPVGFVSSSHLDKLQDEQAKAAPAPLSGGISATTPLIVRAKDGTEYQLTALLPEDSLSADRIDVAMHYRAEPLTDAAAARMRNQKAAAALVDAYPDLREHFHGVWSIAEPASGPPVVSEDAMSQLP